MFGLPSSLPVFVAPAALARLGHPDGEMNLVRAAGSERILQGVRGSLPPLVPGSTTDLRTRFRITPAVPWRR